MAKIRGTNLDDELFGTDANDILYGYAGEDLLYGGSGRDVLVGGEGADTMSGGAGADRLNGGVGADTMSGGTGDDTYFVDDAGDQVLEQVGEGTDLVRSSVAYVLGANVENLALLGNGDLTGTGNDLDNGLTGNNGHNVLDGGLGNDRINGGLGNDTLIGGAGADRLNGGAGADTMSGGAGDDTYFVNNAGDTVIEAAGEGIDLVKSRVAYTLGANVENLALKGDGDVAGTGNGLDNSLTGNIGDNVLEGGLGNDTLYGRAGVDTLIGGEGIDLLVGEAGNDTYFVDNVSDTVVEAAEEGADTVLASVSYTLGANVENLTLTGDSYINATGNDLDNVLTGNWRSNTLNGGVGADTMAGGMGQDVYHVDNVGDVIVEALNEGIDDVISTISYVLGANLENLELLGSAAIDATGNSLGNELFGNSGANILDGGGGNDTLNGRGGADTMIGGTGNDIYFVDTVGDQVIEATGEGTDRVNSSVSYILVANVENLTLTGSADIDGIGNALNNALVGNAGNNVLDGGLGVDAMSGGAGNDTYIVDNVSDTVTEAANAGTDTVMSSMDWTLGANVENLILSGTANLSGSGNDDDNVLTGNGGNNVLIGGAGNDTLDGLQGADTLEGGAGNDTLMGGNGADSLDGDEGDDILYGGLGTDNLTGGAGSDSFVFDTAFTGTNKDTITDFNVADDVIVLDDAVFTALSAGPLSSDAFRIGSAALDADDRIVFNAGTGALSYDADGSGGGLAIQFATLQSPTGILTAADFLVV
jgi:Ca2+-binding RTX toxin-like protein